MISPALASSTQGKVGVGVGGGGDSVVGAGGVPIAASWAVLRCSTSALVCLRRRFSVKLRIVLAWGFIAPTAATVAVVDPAHLVQSRTCP